MNVAFWKNFVPKNKLIPNIIKRQFFEFLISEWAEQHGLRAKGQVKFRKGYLTTNQLFILWILIEQSKAKKKSLYYYFVDFRKVFNILPREELWQVLTSLRVEGHFLWFLQVMYVKDTIRINHPSKGVTSNANKVWSKVVLSTRYCLGYIWLP